MRSRRPYSYAAGTTVQEAYEDFDRSASACCLSGSKRVPTADGGLRRILGARRSKPVGFVALDSGRVVIDDFSALLVGVEKRVRILGRGSPGTAAPIPKPLQTKPYGSTQTPGITP